MSCAVLCYNRACRTLCPARCPAVSFRVLRCPALPLCYNRACRTQCPARCPASCPASCPAVSCAATLPKKGVQDAVSFKLSCGVLCCCFAIKGACRTQCPASCPAASCGVLRCCFATLSVEKVSALLVKGAFSLLCKCIPNLDTPSCVCFSLRGAYRPTCVLFFLRGPTIQLVFFVSCGGCDPDLETTTCVFCFLRGL